MFESIFLGVNLALRLGRKPVLLYPSNHVVSGFQTPGFLNQELREIVLGSETLRCSTCSQLFLTKFLEVNRWVMRGDTFLCKLIRYLVKAVGWNLPVYIGFSGLNVSKGLEKMIGRDGEIFWRQILTSPHYIDLTHRQQSEGARIMQRLGIDQSEPFVCLYVRDNGYEKTRKTPDRPAQCNDIIGYRGLVEFLISSGYTVIRTGDPLMAPAPRFDPRFVDYVHSEEYCDTMDLYLYRHCRFWVGTMGGARYGPMAYGRPSVMVDGVYLSYLGYCLSRSDVFLPKHLYSIEHQRFLSIEEQLNRIAELTDETVLGAEGENYIFVDNLAEEKTAAVREYQKLVVEKCCRWDEELQAKFYSLWVNSLRESFYDLSTKKWRSLMLEQYSHIRPRISEAFLRNCWQYGEYLQRLSDFYNSHYSLQDFETKPEQEI